MIAEQKGEQRVIREIQRDGAGRGRENGRRGRGGELGQAAALSVKVAPASELVCAAVISTMTSWPASEAGPSKCTGWR